MGHYINIISSICVLITSVVAVLTIFIKPLRRALSNREMQNKTLEALIRSHIIRIYFEYNETKKIPSIMMENLSTLYGCCNNCCDNAFISTLYEEMQQWKITD